MTSDTFNAAEFLVQRRVRAGDGDRVAVRCEGVVTTYAELHDLTARVAGGLLGLGVRRGERVAFLASDRTELLAGILGAFWAGAVATPVSTMLTGRELAVVLADSGARVLVVSPEFAAQASVAAAAAPELTHVVVVADAEVTVPDRVGIVSWEQVAAGPAVPVAATTEDTPGLWLYTSGTTGSPKAAMHRHVNIRAVCETYGDRVLGITRDDVCFSVAKLFFAYGLGNSLLFPLSVGATTLLEPRRPSPAVVVERFARDRPTLFFAGPTFFAALLAADLPVDTFTGVRLCASAGEALPATLYRRFTERFGVDVLDGIGSTEVLHIFVSNQPGAVRPGTSGVPVPGYDIELRDAAGHPVGVDEPGALFVRGASLATGYWCRTEATRDVFQGEWLRTGDTYTRSADGYYTCIGRSNDLLKAGGIWVSPAEVEERLLQHPSVAQAAVVGVADSNGLDKPVACVVAVPGSTIDADELVAWCREGLAAFKRPRSVVVVDELPKTATGKIQRFRIREMLSVGATPPQASGAAQEQGAGVPAAAGL